MKKLILNVIGVQMFAQPTDKGGVAAILTKPSASNPSANGVHVVNEAQLRRIVTRCLGIYNPIGFKHIIDMCNGSAKLTIDALECKEGETYETKGGETGTYTKDWTKYSNHEVSLGMIGSMKLAELSLAHAFNQASEQYATVSTPKAVKTVEESQESTGTDVPDEA